MKRISRPRPRHAILQQSDGARWSFTTEETCPDPTLYLLEDVDGWYGGSGVRRKTTDRYGHGTFMGPGFRDGRAMTLKATILCDGPDERDWQERNVSGMLWDGLVGELWVDDGETMLGSPVALDGAPQVVKSGTRALRIQVPLISEEPFVYSEWREVTLDPPGIGVGFEFPPFTGGRMPVGDNLLIDPDGLDPDITQYRSKLGWSFDRYWKKTEDVEGDNSFRFEASSGGFYEEIPLIPGKRYQFTADVYLDAGEGLFRSAVRFTRADGERSYTGDGSEPGGDESVNGTEFTGGRWVTLTRWWDAPEDADRASFDFQINRVEGATEIRLRNPRMQITDPVITFGAEVNRQEYVWNEGNADSYPQFTVFADSPGGFALGLADRLVTYPWPTYPDVPVVVDMAGALFVGGRDQTHLIGERNWSHIPATSLDVPVFKFLQGGTGFCTVAHRDTYI